MKRPPDHRLTPEEIDADHEAIARAARRAGEASLQCKSCGLSTGHARDCKVWAARERP